MVATKETDSAFFVKLGEFVVGRKLEDGTDKIFTRIPGIEWPNSTRLDIAAIQNAFIAMLEKLNDLAYDAVVLEDQSLAQLVESIKAQIRK